MSGCDIFILESTDRRSCNEKYIAPSGTQPLATSIFWCGSCVSRIISCTNIGPKSESPNPQPQSTVVVIVMVFLTNNQIQDWICHVSVSSASIMPSQLIAEFFRRLMVVHAQNLSEGPHASTFSRARGKLDVFGMLARQWQWRQEGFTSRWISLCFWAFFCHFTHFTESHCQDLKSSLNPKG